MATYMIINTPHEVVIHSQSGRVDDSPSDDIHDYKHTPRGIDTQSVW